MPANTRPLTFNIFGKDVSASKTVKGVGKTTQGLGKEFTKLGGLIAGAFAVTKIVQFGKASVAAAADAQVQQNKLATAFAKFPKLADTNQKALDKLNSSLEAKVGIDDDEFASGQAVLAGFKLTGAQITKLTPLLADYAKRTGKDIPTAARDLGKAIQGTGGPLKKIGINFTNLKNPVKNFNELTKKLGSTIGGYALSQTKTFTGQLGLLKTNFGETKESIGRVFLPALTTMVSTINKSVLPLLDRVVAAVGPRISKALGAGASKIGSVFGTIASALKSSPKDGGFLSVLSKASPLLGSLVSIGKGLAPIFPALTKALGKIAPKLVPLIPPLATLVISLLPSLAEIVTDILPLIPVLTGLISGILPILKFLVADLTDTVTAVTGFFNALSGSESLQDLSNQLTGMKGPIGDIATWFGQAETNVLNAATSMINGVINGVYQAINAVRKLAGLPALAIPHFNDHVEFLKAGSLHSTKSSAAGVGNTGGGRKALAAGGIAMPRAGGVAATIAEAGVPEAVIPLSRRSLAQHGLGGGGNTYITNIRALSYRDENQYSQQHNRIMRRATARGAVSGAV